MPGKILGCILLCALAAGCNSPPPTSSLANDTTPERIALNDFVGYFAIRLERASDDIAVTEDDLEVARAVVLMKMRMIPIAQAALLIADNQMAGIQLWVIAAVMKQRVTGEMGKGLKAGQPVALEAATELEERAKALVRGLLTPEQFAVCEKKVDEFAKQQAGKIELGYTPEEARSWGESMSSVLSKPVELIRAPLSSLNPASGLNDTAQAIQHFSDEFSRARKELLYMPSVLRWNTELLYLELIQSESVEAMAGSAQKVGDSAESLAQTAKDLPATLRKELTAFAEDLGQPQAELQETLQVANTTLTNTQHTAESVDAMGATLTGTFHAFNDLMGTFGLPEDGSDDGHEVAPAPAESPPTPAEDEAAPYDINDYGRTAEKVTVTAQALTELLTQAGSLVNAEQSPAILADTETRTRSLLEQTGVLASALVDRIYIGAALLVLFTALVAFVYRMALGKRAVT